MSVPIYQVDAFANRPFRGNPAAICLLAEEADPDWMQDVAAEMNLAETAFVRPLQNGFELRWFTPIFEVDLCGHATLAAAHVLWTESIVDLEATITFHTRSGPLTCRRDGRLIELDFPATPPEPVDAAHELLAALGISEASYIGRSPFDKVVVVDSEELVRSLEPDFARLAEFPMRGVIVSAALENSEFDFISRFFAPAAGVNEDPVTGSAHCCLGPYWAQILGKSDMLAFQASKRGGVVQVRVRDDRILLGGEAVTIMKGELI
ncbi:MAG: PhzF family phenazine biosynthesis protein [Planctomycetaceae bacterium]|nr:PhzF family phenazine biosynthesis protein [Planctomycetaceae bacterium]MCB9950040.1 PhzF family phenazine biosynthesis protein [Planctomycetaceae bacterium]